MKVNRLIVLNASTTDLDEQPAATIVEGKGFRGRLKGLFEQHYDATVTDLEITKHPKIPNSFNCEVTTENGVEEEFVLLKSQNY